MQPRSSTAPDVFVDDLHTLNDDGQLEENSNLGRIYPQEIKLNQENQNDDKAAFFDLEDQILDVCIEVKTYDKRDAFRFEIRVGVNSIISTQLQLQRFQLQLQLRPISRISTPTPTPGVPTPTPIPTPANLQNINSNSNSNSGDFNSNSNSNSGV